MFELLLQTARTVRTEAEEARDAAIGDWCEAVGDKRPREEAAEDCVLCEEAAEEKIAEHDVAAAEAEEAEATARELTSDGARQMGALGECRLSSQILLSYLFLHTPLHALAPLTACSAMLWEEATLCYEEATLCYAVGRRDLMLCYAKRRRPYAMRRRPYA